MKRMLLISLTLLVFGCGTDDNAPDNSSVIQQLTDEECDKLDKKRNKAVKGHKVAICHVPPGNPANAHTIVISKNALETHLDRHNDYIGMCGCGEEEDPGDGDDGTDPGPTEPNEPIEPYEPTPIEPTPSDPADGGFCDGMPTCAIDSDCGNQQACDDLTNCCVVIIQ